MKQRWYDVVSGQSKFLAFRIGDEPPGELASVLAAVVAKFKLANEKGEHSFVATECFRSL